MRVVASGNGNLVVGRSLPGRGAWLCPASPECIETAARRKAFARALRTDVAPEAVAALRVTLGDLRG